VRVEKKDKEVAEILGAVGIDFALEQQRIAPRAQVCFAQSVAPHHAARVGAELGADIVKVNYTGSRESFQEVVAGCPVPVVIAGGEKMETDEELLLMVQGALSAGGCGVSIGRNIFQHEDPTAIIKALDLLVHENNPSKKPYNCWRSSKAQRI